MPPSSSLDQAGRVYLAPGGHGVWSVPRTRDETLGMLSIFHPTPGEALRELISGGKLICYEPNAYADFVVHGVFENGALVGDHGLVHLDKDTYRRLKAGRCLSLALLGDLTWRGLVSLASSLLS